MKTVAGAIAAALVEGGVRRCYTVPGEFYWLLDAIERHPDLTLISTRHESGAAFMAEADARLTGRPACLLAGKAPGATNASNGVETARDASTPMIVLLNEPELRNSRLEAFQQLDLAAFYRPITKAVHEARPHESVPDTVLAALRTAVGGQPGPVMVSIPSDLDGPIDGWVPPALTGVRRAAVPTAEIERVAALLRDAERPVIIAGGGAQHARSELVAVAERFSAGVYAGFRRQDVFPNDHPLYLGHLAMNTPPRTVDALREADGVVVFGSKLAQMTSQRFTVPRPGVRLAQVDIDPARIGMLMPVEVGVVCDARIALAALAAEPGAPARDWSRAHATFLESTVIPPDRSTGAGVDPSQIIRAMAEVLPEDTVITSEAGGHATFGHQHWLFRHPRTQAAPQNGTMGYAVPAAVAAKIALPDRVVVADVGDGGFLMTGQEIETSVRENAPIIVVVFNNSLLSAGFETASMRENRPYNLISTVDFAAYARAMGAQGITVTSTEELVPAFEKAHHAGVTTVLDIRTDAEIFSPRLEPLRM